MGFADFLQNFGLGFIVSAKKRPRDSCMDGSLNDDQAQKQGTPRRRVDDAEQMPSDGSVPSLKPVEERQQSHGAASASQAEAGSDLLPPQHERAAFGASNADLLNQPSSYKPISLAERLNTLQLSSPWAGASWAGGKGTTQAATQLPYTAPMPAAQTPQARAHAPPPQVQVQTLLPVINRQLDFQTPLPPARTSGMGPGLALLQRPAQPQGAAPSSSSSMQRQTGLASVSGPIHPCFYGSSFCAPPDTC